MNSDSESPRSLPPWRFWVPLVLQTALIVGVPAQAVYTHLTGKTAILQTAPVDPYDLLRGYSQTLTYDISRQDTLEKLPGWKELTKNKPQYKPLSLYVVMEAPTQQVFDGRPKAWKPVRVSSDRPSNLPANQVALKGILRYRSVTYGIETYYFPEDRRERFNNDINKAQSGEERRQGKPLPFVVEVKVDAQGNAVPVSLWVRDRNYRF